MNFDDIYFVSYLTSVIRICISCNIFIVILDQNTEKIISIFLEGLIVLHFSNYNGRTQISNSMFRGTTFTTNWLMLTLINRNRKIRAIQKPFKMIVTLFLCKIDEWTLLWILFCLVGILWSGEPLFVSKILYIYIYIYIYIYKTDLCISVI